MTKAFLDTTIVVNILLKRGELHDRCRTALQRFDKVSFPAYALKEMKAGALYSWIWLHNRCVAEKSYERVMRAIHAMANTRRKNLTSSALEALAETGASRRMQMGSLVQKYGPSANEDTVHCDRMRLGLRKRITTAWAKRRAFGAEISDPLPCYTNEDLTMKLGLIECHLSCDWKRGCEIAEKMSHEPEKVSALRAVAQSDPSRQENIRRSQVLRHIVRTPNRPINNSQCRAIGDAVFAFFAPPDTVILTTNIRDHGPLAKAVGKRAEEP
jgi:hypothetical protein